MGWKTGLVGWTLLVASLGLWPQRAQAGRLDSVRSEVSGSSDSSSSSSDSSSSYDSDSSSDDSDSSGSCCTSSSAGGSSDGFVTRPGLRYRHYPYEGGSTNYMFTPRPTDTRARKRAAQVWGEGAWQGRGLWRSAGGLRIDGQFLGFDGDLSYYLEPAANDALYLGTANLNLIPLRTNRGILRLGGGLNTMIDGRVPAEGHREYALGWNVTSSLDLFPAWPVVISARGDVGRLYNAWMGRARASVGVMLWRMEIFGGYEHTQVGRVGLGGPMVGVRLWL